MKQIIALFIAALLPLVSQAQYTGFQRSLSDTPWGIIASERDKKEPVYAGKRAERFELRQGDCSAQPGWSDCAMDRERVEMSELKPYTQLGQPTWYSWAVLFDQNWPDISPVTTTVGQFHQRDVSAPAVLFIQRNGIYGLRIESAKSLYVNRDWYPLVSSQELRGRWHTVLVYARWSTGADGELMVWVNGQLKADIKGPNTINTTPVYFKYGIYRSFVSRVQNRPTQVLYFDEVRKGPTRESVDLRGNARFKPVN